MIRFLAFLFFSSLTLGVTTQEMAKRMIYASYYQRYGEPGRTIEKINGSKVHLMPVTHSETILKIMRCGRAKHTTVGYTMNQLKSFNWCFVGGFFRTDV